MRQLAILLLALVVGFAVTVSALTPCNSPPVQCIIDPCRIATCPAFSNAVCESDYCSGCDAQFYVQGVYVSKRVCTSGFDGIEPKLAFMSSQTLQKMDTDYDKAVKPAPVPTPRPAQVQRRRRYRKKNFRNSRRDN